ncbi:MAG: hypothetical protein OCD02_05190 [Spirochaetaceae bacterium]
MSAYSYESRNFFKSNSFRFNSIPSHSPLNYSIQTTERTWGVDLENLIRNHFSTLIFHQSKVKSFLKDFDYDRISLVFFLITSLLSSFEASWFMSNKITDTFNNINTIDISSKIDWISEVISSGLWANFFLGIIALIGISILISIPIGEFLDSKSNINVSSHFLFNEEAMRNKELIDKKYKVDWQKFFSTVILGVISSITASILVPLIVNPRKVHSLISATLLFSLLIFSF